MHNVDIAHQLVCLSRSQTTWALYGKYDYTAVPAAQKQLEKCANNNRNTLVW